MSQEMVGEFRGRRYTWGCNPYDEGMSFELVDSSGPLPKLVLEAHFYFDRDGPTFTSHRPELPFEMVEWFVKTTRQMLPPKKAL